MAIALVHQGGNNGSSPTLATTITATTAGNFLVAVVAVTNGLTPTISDSSGSNSWSQAVVKTSIPTGFDYYIFYCPNAASVTSISIAATGATKFVNVAEFSGVATSSVTDGSNSTNGASGLTVRSGTLTTTNANDLLIALATKAPNGDGPPNNGIGGGFTPFSTALTGAAYQIVSATGTYEETGDYTFGSTDAWAGVIAAFKAAASGTSTSSTQTVRVTGQVVTSTQQPVRATGQSTSAKSVTARATGQLSTSSTQPVRATGQSTSSSRQDVRVTSQSGSVVNREVRVVGQLTTSSTQAMRLVGQQATPVSLNVRAAGEFATATSATSLSARTTAQEGVSASLSVRASGYLPSSQISLGARTRGQSSATASYGARATGVGYANRSIGVRLVGTQGTLSRRLTRNWDGRNYVEVLQPTSGNPFAANHSNQT